MKKIAIICPESKNIVNFRKNLIIKLQSEGYSVSAIVFDDKYVEEIRNLGVEPFVIYDNNRTLNPVKLFSLKRKYAKVIKSICPNIVFTFMLKPNIYGVRGASLAGVKKIFAMVEGGGDVFGKKGLLWFIIRKYCCLGLKRSFKKVEKVFFINNDDKKEFIARKLVNCDKAEVVHGIGVDLEYFTYKPIKNYNVFLMVSRLMKAKGVLDFCKAAHIVKQSFPTAVFNLVGGESTLKVYDIQEFIDSGDINYLGKTDDIRPFYEDCAVQVLPTYYREGLGLVNAEAGATGRPTITCDVIGARDTVIDGYNGLFVLPENPKDLSEKMIFFLENPKKVYEMGLNNRKYAEKNFDQKIINEYIVNTIENE